MYTVSLSLLLFQLLKIGQMVCFTSYHQVFFFSLFTMFMFVYISVTFFGKYMWSVCFCTILLLVLSLFIVLSIATSKTPIEAQIETLDIQIHTDTKTQTRRQDCCTCKSIWRTSRVSLRTKQ